MAFNHISFNKGTAHGAKLRSMLDTNESGDDQLTDQRNVMVQMLDGDGSQDAHFAEIVKRFGVADFDSTQGDPNAAQLAKAHEMFQEIDTVYQQTIGISAARNQLYNKLRG